MKCSRLSDIDDTDINMISEMGVFSFLRKLSTCPHLLQRAVLLRRGCCGAPSTRQSLIDISCPPGAQQQTCRTQLLPLIDGTDKQTDGRSIVSKTLLRQCQ